MTFQPALRMREVTVFTHAEFELVQETTHFQAKKTNFGWASMMMRESFLSLDSCKRKHMILISEYPADILIDT